MRRPPDNLADAQALPRCQCCARPIYDHSFQMNCNINDFAPISSSIVMMFHFLRFICSLISLRSPPFLPHHRHLHPYPLPSHSGMSLRLGLSRVSLRLRSQLLQRRLPELLPGPSLSHQRLRFNRRQVRLLLFRVAKAQRRHGQLRFPPQLHSSLQNQN